MPVKSQMHSVLDLFSVHLLMFVVDLQCGDRSFVFDVRLLMFVVELQCGDRLFVFDVRLLIVWLFEFVYHCHLV